MNFLYCLCVSVIQLKEEYHVSNSNIFDWNYFIWKRWFYILHMFIFLQSPATRETFLITSLACVIHTINSVCIMGLWTFYWIHCPSVCLSVTSQLSSDIHFLSSSFAWIIYLHIQFNYGPTYHQALGLPSLFMCSEKKFLGDFQTSFMPIPKIRMYFMLLNLSPTVTHTNVSVSNLHIVVSYFEFWLIRCKLLI